MNAAQVRQSQPGGAGLEAEHALDDAPQSYRSRPREGTIRGRVLSALEAGERLTSLEAWQRFGTSRLAADVYELKRMGWPVMADEVEVANRDGRPTHVARYRLAEGA